MSKKPKKDKEKKKEEKPRVNPELSGFDVHIDPFGEIKTNYNIDKINEFLNRNVDDKKLREKEEKENQGENTNDEEDEK
ncbi:MAG: hypothetical protein ACOCXH_07035 [Cyclobacteriaceae bacterium]